MNLEKFLFKKIPIWILLLTVIFSLLFALWFGERVTRSKTAYNIATTPQKIKKSLSGYYTLAIKENRFKNKKGLYVYSPSSENEYLLISRYDGNLNRHVVELINVNKKKIIHTWKPNINKINSLSKLPKKRIDLKKDHNLKRFSISHPMLLENGDLLIHGNYTPLTKIDICSKLIWSLDHIFHHRLEKDHENNFWLPFSFYPNKVNAKRDEKVGTSQTHFRDDGIMKISIDGKILFKKSIIEMFLDNDMEQLIFPGEPSISFDPIHLNDIQPVLSDGKYFLTGDLFLSLRHLSTIVLYRPSTNKILWFKKNPWVLQHDVDILNGEQISIFDNKDLLNSFYKYPMKYNNILIYDFNKNKILNNYYDLFKKFDIRTPTRGAYDINKDGSIFVEESDFGRLMKIGTDGEIIWEYINRANDGKLYRLDDSRLIKKVNTAFFNNLQNTRCDEK